VQVIPSDIVTRLLILIAVSYLGQAYLYYLLYRKGIITRSEIGVYFRIVTMVMPYWGQEVARDILNDATHFFADKWKIKLAEKPESPLEKIQQKIQQLQQQPQPQQPTQQKPQIPQQPQQKP